MTLVELLVAMALLSLLIFGAMSLFINLTRQTLDAQTDHELSQDNAMGLRRVTEALRPAVQVQISPDGKRIAYWLPKLATVPDPDTGETEYLRPIEPELNERAFAVVGDTLYDEETGEALVVRIAELDPDPESTQYNQAYAPFQLTSIGSERAVTINLVTFEETPSGDRWVRMKTTAIVRNNL